MSDRVEEFRLRYLKYMEELPFRFTIKQMGTYFGDVNWLRLNRDFVNENLDLWELEYKLDRYDQRAISKIFCPCCKEGKIEMIQAKKDICEVHVVETGMNYKFKCSNDCINESTNRKLYITYSYTHTYC